MNDVWLVIDAPNQCWRFFHVMGGLNYGAEQTGLAYGVLKEVLRLTERFGVTRTVWAFDRGVSLRTLEYPDYKKSRRDDCRPDAERETRSAARRQIVGLEADLSRVGFANVFGQEGYEADDVIASVVGEIPDGDEVLIMSSDKDLYQLIGPNVKVLTGKRLLDLQGFYADYRIRPHRWADVKAICGCDSDDVAGIKGVGEKTALKHLRKELDPESHKGRLIEKGRGVWERNLDLVTLPYPGCRLFPLREDAIDVGRWRAYCARMGFKSIAGHFERAKQGRLFA
jgi:5'-3' exonuclease